MEYYFYHHDCEPEAITKLKTGVKLIGKKKNIKHLLYCNDCKSYIVGKWGYYDYCLEFEALGKNHKTPFYFENAKLSLNDYKNLIKKRFEKEYDIESRIADEYYHTCMRRINGADVHYDDSEAIRKTLYKRCLNELNLALHGFDDSISAFYFLPENAKIRTFLNEINNFKNMTICPICGEKLASKIPTKSERREEANLTAEKKVDELIKKNKLSLSKATFKFENMDAKTLKEYVKQVFSIETLILETSTRLKTLYALHSLAEDDLISAKHIYLSKIKQNYINAKNEYETATKYRFVPSVKLQYFPIDLPLKPFPPQEPPILPPKEPTVPFLEKPGFLNKKRVMANNQLLTEKYELALKTYHAELESYNKAFEIYNAKLEAYNKEMTEYNNTVSKLHQAQKNMYDDAVREEKNLHIQKIEGLKQKLNEEKIKFETSEKEEIISPEQIKFNLIDAEVNKAVDLLEKAIQTRNELYSCDVIFEKYRNIVTIASFYEYLSSGRCNELEGAGGAYNLYENELLMNKIVSQLSKVIDLLEEIKDNQYMIYSTLQKITYKLTSIDDSMTKALDKISTLKNHLSNIENNTQVIAYNTEATAFYAEKNAELTNALGYLVALS